MFRCYVVVHCPCALITLSYYPSALNYQLLMVMVAIAGSVFLFIPCHFCYSYIVFDI